MKRSYRDAVLPSLFGDYADYGSVDPLFKPLAEDAPPVEETAVPPAELDALPAEGEGCEWCGAPCALRCCDDCLDDAGRGER